MIFRTEPFNFSGTLIRSVLLALLLVVSGVVSSIGQDGGERKRVLVVFNNDSFTATQAKMDQALRTTLKESLGVQIETYSEYVGDTRSGADYEQEFVALIKRKYEGKKFDLIYAVTRPTLGILTRNRDELFPGTPIVLLSLDRRDLVNADPANGITAVTGEINFKSNLDLALAQHPGTKRVVLMNGLAETDKYWTSRAESDFKEYESRLEISNLTGLTVPEMRDSLSKLPPDTIVFFVTSIRDNAGNIYESPLYLKQVASASTAPIYGTTEAQLGMGIVGGFLVGFDAIGNEGGKVGLRLLAGESTTAVAPHAIAPLPLFDWRELQRWDISEATLPPGSVVRFRQPTVWDEYKWYAIGLLAAVIVETLLIVFLVYLRIRRRQAEEDAARIANRLGDIVANVPGIVWETRTDPVTKKRVTTFISDYVQRMLGYTSEEWMKQPSGFGFEQVVEEDREKARSESEAIMANGHEGVSEFRWTTKDGRIRWVENYLSPLVEKAQIVGLRGVAIDVTDRKVAEELAREAEQKDRAILSAIPDLMFIQSLDGVYLDYHATDEQALFVPPETFLGKNIRDVLPPDLADRFFETFASAEEGGGPKIVEYQLEIAGENRWYEARMVRTGDKILSMVRDITDRVRALEELLRSEERFGKAFRANPQPMAVTTIRDGRYIDVNDSFTSVSGYSREEVIGRTTLELGVWPAAGARETFIEVVRKNGSIDNFETEFRAKDGSIKQFLTSAERVELGGEDCLLVASTDITERYAAEKAVQESEARFRNMAETAPVMIWMSSPDQVATYLNKQFLDFTGNSHDKEIVNDWTRRLHPEDLEACVAKYTDAFQRRAPYELEARVLRVDGEYRWVISTGIPRFSADGEFLGYIGTSLDITERKRSEEELRQAHEELGHLKTQLEAENIYLQEELRQDQSFGDIVGQSSAIKYVLFKVTQVAPTDSTVLIIGETGTGKELVARAIHEASPRKERPLIKVNCAALSPTLIESELFGHEKGSFTGAGARRLGRFELANTGTILLDEIGELPLDLQSKLLRVLQEGEFERVGGAKTIKTDVRVIASTNRDLKKAVEKGAFREDLWYRLNVFPITTPPLRDRRDDIRILTEYFGKSFARKLGKNLTGISPETLEALSSYSWPGNVRELANVIERSVINLRGTVLRIEEDFRIREAETLATSVKTLDDNERDHILRVLEDLDWRIGGPGGAGSYSRDQSKHSSHTHGEARNPKTNQRSSEHDNIGTMIPD